MSLGFNPAESNEVVVLLVTFNETVNFSSTIELNCVAHGRTSAPSIEWASVANGSTTVIRNSTSNRVIVPPDHAYICTMSTPIANLNSPTDTIILCSILFVHKASTP